MHRCLNYKLTSIGRKTEFDKEDVVRLVECTGTLVWIGVRPRDLIVRQHVAAKEWIRYSMDLTLSVHAKQQANSKSSSGACCMSKFQAATWNGAGTGL